MSIPESAPDAAPALTPVQPAEPLAPWIGGKRNLAKAIVQRIEAMPHTCYAEPFCGMGGIFLRRPNRPRSEILNDINPHCPVGIEVAPSTVLIHGYISWCCVD